MSRKNIFENVEIIGYKQPMNEIGGFTSALIALAGWTLIKGTFKMINNNPYRNKQINIIRGKVAKFPPIKKFIDNEYDNISITNLKTLLKYGIINNKEFDKVSAYSHVSTYLMYNQSNKIIASCIYINDKDMNNASMYVKILDNKYSNDKYISLYINYLFEYYADINVSINDSNLMKLYDMIDEDKKYGGMEKTDNGDGTFNINIKDGIRMRSHDNINKDKKYGGMEKTDNGDGTFNINIKD